MLEGSRDCTISANYEEETSHSHPGKSLKKRFSRHVFKIDNGYLFVKEKISYGFYRFGLMVGRHPVIFSLVPLFLTICLGMGMFNLKVDDDTEKLFTPVGSPSFTDRRRIREIFTDTTSWNFDAFGLVDIPSEALLIFRQGGEDTVGSTRYFAVDVNRYQKENNIYDEQSLVQIQRIVAKVKNITVELNGKTYGLEDLCARTVGNCVMDGEQYILPDFIRELKVGRVTYPRYRSALGPADISFNLAGALLASGNLTAARVIKIRFFWRVDRVDAAMKWNAKFLKLVRSLESGLTGSLHMAYSTSESLQSELLEGTKGDTIYFTLTIALMVIYSVFVSAGGDVVSSRALLACGGVLAAGMGIVSAMGLLCLAGVDYINFVGIMPYLVLGIGVDDMFLLMSAWGETIGCNVGVPERVGLTFSKAGIGITITTLTDFLAFFIGVYSKFIAVRRFCLFTGLAVLLCYVCNCTLFGACMSLHGDRVYAAKHCLTCQPTRTREDFKREGSNACKVYCCGGSVPQTSFQDESLCEQLPRFLLPRLILNPVAKVLLLLAFLTYLSCAVYGAIKLQPGMKYVDLVLRSSYYYKYSTWDELYFGQRLAIAFIVDEEIDYAGKEGDIFRRMLNEVQRDPKINDKFLRCWLHSYSRSPFYPPKQLLGNHSAFIRGLHAYLQYDKHSQNDVRFDNSSSRILASRCYVLTVNDVSIFNQSELMIRMRALADRYREHYVVFSFQPIFIMLEHTIAILPSTLQTIGTAVAVMFVVTLVMLPQLLMVSLVTLNIVFIITCVFGFMYFLDIQFSGISMIHILMSVGFSVDFSAHICAAYLMSDSPTRIERARYALVHASGPIFNGGMSSLVGVSVLLLSESYFFSTFFKIMSMVITAGAINSVFFMPIVLSYIGPEHPQLSHPTSRRHTLSPIQSRTAYQMSSRSFNGHTSKHRSSVVIVEPADRYSERRSSPTPVDTGNAVVTDRSADHRPPPAGVDTRNAVVTARSADHRPPPAGVDTRNAVVTDRSADHRPPPAGVDTRNAVISNRNAEDTPTSTEEESRNTATTDSTPTSTDEESRNVAITGHTPTSTDEESRNVAITGHTPNLIGEENKNIVNVIADRNTNRSSSPIDEDRENVWITSRRWKAMCTPREFRGCGRDERGSYGQARGAVSSPTVTLRSPCELGGPAFSVNRRSQNPFSQSPIVYRPMSLARGNNEHSNVLTKLRRWVQSVMPRLSSSATIPVELSAHGALASSQRYARTSLESITPWDHKNLGLKSKLKMKTAAGLVPGSQNVSKSLSINSRLAASPAYVRSGQTQQLSHPRAGLASKGAPPTPIKTGGGSSAFRDVSSDWSHLLSAGLKTDKERSPLTTLKAADTAHLSPASSRNDATVRPWRTSVLRWKRRQAVKHVRSRGTEAARTRQEDGNRMRWSGTEEAGDTAPAEIKTVNQGDVIRGLSTSEGLASTQTYARVALKQARQTH